MIYICISKEESSAVINIEATPTRNEDESSIASRIKRRHHVKEFHQTQVRTNHQALHNK